MCYRTCQCLERTCQPVFTLDDRDWGNDFGGWREAGLGLHIW